MSQRLTVTRLGMLGDGLAGDHSGGPVVVPGTLPGEVVEGLVSDGQMDAPRILTPVADRVAPPCSHAKGCGGCNLQHASDPFVAGWKRTRVVDALAAKGIEAEVGATRTSPPRSRRRAGFAGKRTKKGALIGFHGRQSHTLVDVPGCELVTSAVRAALPRLAEMVVAGGSRRGEVSFQVTDTLGGVDVAASGGKPLDLVLRTELAEIGQGAGLARLTWDGEQVAQWAAPEMQMGPARVTLPPGAFLQATAHGEAALVAAVAGVIGDAKRVADLFCGCGTFALPLSARVEVLALEADPAQTGALNAAWRQATGLKALKALPRDLFRRPLERDELAGLDAVVIDPPRAGAAAQMAVLAQSDVPRIAAVSCNPNTFARDAATLIAGGYKMGPVTVVDQFRWSPHVELVAGFHRP